MYSCLLYFLEVNFSFVSLEIGIPFATTEGALTIFDCDAATRYSNDINDLQFPIIIIL